MTSIPSDKAREELGELIEHVSKSHEPVQIQGEHGSAVLVAEDDWRAIQETLFLVSIPGMRASIRAGMAESADECDETPGW